MDPSEKSRSGSPLEIPREGGEGITPLHNSGQYYNYCIFNIMDTLTSVPVASTVNSHLAKLIEEATTALPQAHRCPPVAGETFETPELALRRLQNWAFTQGFAVVIKSHRKNRKMTGHEAALQAEIDKQLRRRRDAVEAEAELIERQYILAEMRAETQLQASQRESPTSQQPGQSH
jgi:hypothetical protein